MTPLVLLLAALASPSVERPATPAPNPPNILVLVLDDLGCEKLRPYSMGAPYAHTPVLQMLSARGVTFTNHYANPLCGPTRALLQTGRYAFRTGFGPNIFPDYQFGLNPLETCVSEMLRDGFAPATSPYARGAFGKWHMSTYPDLTHPLQCGFEQFKGCVSNVTDASAIYNTLYHHYYWRKNEDGVETVIGSPTGPFDEVHWSASVTARDAGDWMMAQARPFFAMVNLNVPHAPYQVPPWSLVSSAGRGMIEQLGVAQIGQPYREGDFAWPSDLTHPTHPLTLEQLAEKKRVFYDVMIESMDTCIGQILARIAPKMGDTIVFVVGDNGTEASVVDDTRYDPNRTKRTCYQLGVRAPLIVAGAYVASPGRTCTQPVGSVDMWRTIRDLAGAREVPGMIPHDIVIDSVSFLPYLLDPNAPRTRPYAFSEVFNPIGNPAHMSFGARQRMITDGNWKLIRTGLDEIEELYHIAVDPLELQNLLPYTSMEQKDRYDELKLELDQLIYSDG